MSNKFRQLGFFRLSAIAAAMAVVSPLAVAGVVTTLTEAKGSYKLGAAATVNLLDSTNGSSVDVLAFPGNYGQANSAGLHSYGSPTGNFGSRSSGYGVYEVTGSFRIEQTITNTSLFAQNAIFNFFITPGQLSSDIGTALSDSEFLTSGLIFDIRRDGGQGRDSGQVWGSSATLSSNASGTTFLTGGDSSLYSGSGTYYTVNGVHRSVDLGVLNASESLTLSYQLDSFVRGNSKAGMGRVVPETSYFVPDQWIETCTGGYGGSYGDGYGDGYGNTPLICTPLLIPGHTVIVPSHTVLGRAGGSTAQSGDPFDIAFLDSGRGFGDVSFSRIGPSAQPPNDIPEPGALALFLAALGIAGWTTQRRRSPAVGPGH